MKSFYFDNKNKKTKNNKNSDTLVSRGIKTVPNVSRVVTVGESVGILTTGSIADTQCMVENLRGLELEDMLVADGCSQTSPKDIFSYLKLVIYNKRSNFEPWMIGTIVGGKEQGEEPFLGWINSIGLNSQANCASVGIANYLCDNLLQDATEGDKWKSLSREDALQLIYDCMKILATQDCTAFSRIQVTEMTDAGIEKHSPVNVAGDLCNYVSEHTLF